MIRPAVAAAAIVLPFALACGGGAPDVANPSNYNTAGVSFDYPGNWTLETEVDIVDGVTMNGATIEAPGGALFILYNFSEEMTFTAESFADDLMVEMPLQLEQLFGDAFDYSQGASSPSYRAFAGSEKAGARRSFTLGVLGVDVPHTLDVYSVVSPGHHVIIYHQWANEDAGKVEPGFEQIFNSMKIE